MIHVTNRAEMKEHLINRVNLLEAQFRRESRGPMRALTRDEVSALNSLRQRINGIEEALECIRAWEFHEISELFDATK